MSVIEHKCADHAGRTVNLLLGASEVNSLDSSDLLSGSYNSTGRRSGRGVDGRDKGSARRSAELLRQWRSESSGECAGGHFEWIWMEWSGLGERKRKMDCVCLLMTRAFELSEIFPSFRDRCPPRLLITNEASA